MKLQFRIKDEYVEQIDKTAKGLGKTRSEFIRDIVIESCSTKKAKSVVQTESDRVQKAKSVVQKSKVIPNDFDDIFTTPQQR